MKNIIASLDSFSPIEGRVRPGDALLSVNGKPVADVLDYKFFSYDAVLNLTLRRPDGSEYTVRVKKAEGEDLGINFESYLMDSPRSCANNCVFCFIDQLPPGMRPTMYFKDDDARLSFLLGNYITLTNLSERELQRIIDLRISPVNVSVHTTNPDLRVSMLRNPRAAEINTQLRRLAEGGITLNCQVVCCPGLNDGEELLRTMRDLEALYPAVHSVSVIPVGLTDYREGLYPLTPFTEESAARLIDEVTAFGDGCVDRHGERVFFCGDELYLKAGRELPDAEFYEDYAQFENGVGMLRAMENEFGSALTLSDDPGPISFSIATGVAAAPLFEKLVCKAEAKYATIKGRVYAVENDFFGRSVTVAGLVTGRDLIAALKGKELGDRLLISNNMIRRAERDFLDGITLEEASGILGVEIIPTEQDGFALWDAMQGIHQEEQRISPVTGDEEFYRYNP